MLPRLSLKKHWQNDLLKQVKQHKAALKIADRMTLLDILDDNKTIITKNGQLVQLIQFEGVDYSGISHEEKEALFILRRRFFAALSNEVKLSFYYLRKNITSKSDQSLKFSNKYAEIISKKWQENFDDTYKTEIYLAVKIPIPKNLIHNNQLTYLTRRNYQNLIYYSEKLDSFTASICKSLNNYSPKIVTHNKYKSSDLTNFWSYLVNGKEINIGNESINIGDIIASSDIEFNKEKRLITFHGDNYKKYGKILGIKFYPENTNEDIFKYLLRLKHQFTIIQNILPIDREYNKFQISRKIKHAESLVNIGFMHSRLQDLEEAGEALESGKVNFINHSLQILVLADSEKDLETSSREIEAALNHGGITTISEGMALEIAFWSLFPDYENISGRKVKITSENLADFITLGSSHEGLNKCSFGSEAVSLFKTVSHSNYSFTFHGSPEDNALGHTIVIGGSGSGKTTLVSFLLMNCLKYSNFKLLAFDSYQGLKIPLSSFGGNYTTIGQDKNLQLNPMLLKNTHSNISFLQKWIADLCGGVESHEEKIIAEAIRQNYELDKKHRSLTSIRALGKESTPNKTGRNIAERIAKWLPAEEDNSFSHYNYGMLFNSKSDSLDFKGQMVGFDMAGILNDSELLGAISSYIFHAFSAEINNNPAPHILFIDEMVQYINNPIFAPFIAKGVREIRKRNGVLIGAVQEASALTDSEIGKIIINNASTYILFPDPTANPEDYLSSSEDQRSSKVGLGLTDSEFIWIKTANPEREVMVKRRGGESIILNTDLASLGKYLNLFSSNIKDIRNFEQSLSNSLNNGIADYLESKPYNQNFIN